MARFGGVIGFIKTVDDGNGVFKEVTEERTYYGDVNRRVRKVVSGTGLNDDIDISNEISIVADAYAMNNFSYMKYIKWMNCLWKISSADVQYPRLVLSIGGLYNGDESN